METKQTRYKGMLWNQKKPFSFFLFFSSFFLLLLLFIFFFHPIARSSPNPVVCKNLMTFISIVTIFALFWHLYALYFRERI